MSPGPLLTVAIPTFNRAAYLELCLTRLAEELEALPPADRQRIAIRIFDNDSTDDTSSVAQRFSRLYPTTIRYTRNENNIGADLNIVRCYQTAETPYVWVLGDDDVVLPKALDLILKELVPETVDVLYLNGYGFFDDYAEEPKRGRHARGAMSLPQKDFVKRTHVMLTFITALIVRTNAARPSDVRVVAGTRLMQLSWVLALIRDGKNFRILKNRVFAAKAGNSGGYSAIDVFGTQLKAIAESMFSQRPELAKIIQNGAIIYWFTNYIYDVRRGKSLYDNEALAKKIGDVFRGNWRYYVFLLPLIFLPRPLMTAFFLIVRATRKLFSGAIL